MSNSGYRGGPTNYHFGGDGDHNKRKKPYFPSSTRRDFKSPASEAQAGAGRPSVVNERRVSGELPSRQRYRDSSRENGLDLRDLSRDPRDLRDTSWDARASGRDSGRDRDIVRERDTARDRDIARDSRDIRENRETRDGRDLRDARDMRDARDIRDRDIRDSRDSRDSRDARERDSHRDHRDSLFSASSTNPSRNPRGSGYNKDYRYGSYSKQYSLYGGNSYSERGGAYGSFSGSKRQERTDRPDRAERPERPDRADEYFSNYSSRDTIARDTSTSKDSWRSEKPRQSSAPRFNPNNIPVNLRSNLSSNVAPTSSEPQRDRYENYDDQYSTKWNSYSRRPENYSRTERSASDYNIRPSNPARDRPGSSSLTNTVNPVKQRISKSFSSYNRQTDHYPNGKPNYSSESRTRDYTPPPTGPRMSKETNMEDMQQDLHDSLYLYDKSIKQHAHSQVDDERVDVKIEHEISSEHSGTSKHTSPIGDFSAEVEPGVLDTSAKEETELDQKETSSQKHHDEPGAENEEEGDDEEEEDDDDDDDEDDEDDDEEANDEDSVYTPPIQTSAMSEHSTEDGLGIEDSQHTKVNEINSAKLATLSFNPELEPVMYPDGCSYPQTKLAAEYDQLEAQYNALESKSKFANGNASQDFTHHQFYYFNLTNFVDNYDKQFKIVYDNKKETKKHQLKLWIKYEKLRRDNDKRSEFMKEQLQVLHPGDDEATRELMSIDTRPKVGSITPQNQVVDAVPPGGRRNRRHGDLVTTEAEFQEILKTLENEEKESPLAKAKRVAATIPELLVDPDQRKRFVFMDSNNFVFDKEKWASRINTDFVDTFTEIEHDLFCEAFCQYPKKFGQVSQAMGGLRLSQECVIHYYMTKKAVNYKALVSQYKKKAKKSIRRKKKKTLPPSSAEESSQVKEDSEIDAEGSAVPLVKSDENSSVETADGLRPEKRRIEELTSNAADEPSNKKPREPADTSLPGDEPMKAESPSPSGDNDNEGEDIEEDEEDLKDGLSGDDKRKSISSYWSITETNEFPHLLNQFGSQWSKIAEKLATKSATMVRNQYQRKGKKYGWTKVVAAADQRLARKPYVAGENRYSKFDTTLIVKPQRSTNAVLPNTEIHVYDTGEQSQGKPNSAPSDRISVSNLMGSPLVSESGSPTVSGQFSPVPANASPSTRFFTQTPVESSNAPSGGSLFSNSSEAVPQLASQSTFEASSSSHSKPSIMNLLNGDSPVRTQNVAITVAAPVRTNISSLLNTPSSPAGPTGPSQMSNVGAPHRSSNINSLLG